MIKHLALNNLYKSRVFEIKNLKFLEGQYPLPQWDPRGSPPDTACRRQHRAWTNRLARDTPRPRAEKESTVFYI